MTRLKHSRGTVRDAIVACLDSTQGSASVADIRRFVETRIGVVPTSSVRSYLRQHPNIFERTQHGRYQLRSEPVEAIDETANKSNDRMEPVLVWNQAALYREDCFDWMERREENSIHAVVTDPPYGLVEYTEIEQRKLRAGRGGVWRLPPSFDGHQRSPVSRFTILGEADFEHMRDFLNDLGKAFLAYSFRVPMSSLLRTRWCRISLPRDLLRPAWRAEG